MADASPDNIFCGVAGWSYPDWQGFVYGPEVRDTLRFMAGYVDVIEVNSSFYRPPTAQTVASWVRRTADLPGFFFTAKIHQDITHRGVIDPGMVETFHRGFDPMVKAGKLRHLLAQFRYDFADTAANREWLQRIRAAFGDMANVTYELRHASWQAPDALDFVAGLPGTVANLDFPMGRDSFSLRLCTAGEHAYFRLHGRNAKAWFSKSGRDETYNYLYPDREIADIVKRALALAKMSKTLTLVANNHYQGKEAVNILQIKSQIAGGKVDVPPRLAQRYPELQAIRKDAGQRDLGLP